MLLDTRLWTSSGTTVSLVFLYSLLIWNSQQGLRLV